jgi:hypothetical protein
MNTFKKILKKIDELAPDPWYVEGVKQARPLTQIVTFFSGVIIGLIIFHFYSK